LTRVIAVCSGKGGAGKTTITANLGARLAEMGRDVVVIDTNLTTPNLGMHLGMPLFPVTLHDVLKGRASINDAIYEHENGLKIIPAGISLRDLRGTDARDLPNALLDLLGNVDIILLDTAAGLGREAIAALEAADELLVVTNPEMPSVTDALKAMKMAEQLGTKPIGLVVNKRTRESHEMSSDDITLMLDGLDIVAEIPHDNNISKSLAVRRPVVYQYPKSDASYHIRRLASFIADEEFTEKIPLGKRIRGLLGLK
jgi:septum site-determining protein MinD